MRIFADRHHGDLAYSLQLMAKRLGAEIYFPFGVDWYHKGYWKIADPYPDPMPTVHQYLTNGFKPVDGTVPLSEVKSSINGVYEIEDTVHGTTLKGISYDAFMATHFDVVIASFPNHGECYQRLANEKGCKFVQQIGNIWQTSNAKNQLIATSFIPPEGTNFVRYAPEFDTYYFNNIQIPTQAIVSLINCLPQKDRDYRWWRDLQVALPTYVFASYGGGCDNGSLGMILEQAKKIIASKFVYHVKEHGDGYGFVIHYALAAHRPVITSMKDYRDKVAGKWLEHGKTCIDIDQFPNMAAVAKYITDMSEHDYSAMIDNLRKKAYEVFDFEQQAESIKQFFNNLA